MASNKEKMKAKIKKDAKAGKQDRDSRQRDQWKGMAPEERAALEASDPNKANAMRFGKFAGYDPSTKGGKSFDGRDVKYLQNQGWKNNDILRAAASSNHVNERADRLLGGLNQPLDIHDRKDRRILEKGRDALGITGMLAANQGQVRFLGGDPEKKSSWAFGYGEEGSTKGPMIKGQQTWHDNDYLAGTPIQMATLNKKDATVYNWGGRNADGTANALGGYEIENRDGDWRHRETSWAMDRGLANRRFAGRMDEAEKHRNPGAVTDESGQDGTVEAAEPPLKAYDGGISGADYGVKDFTVDTGTSIFDAFTDSLGDGKRFAASEAVKQRLGFA